MNTLLTLFSSVLLPLALPNEFFDQGLAFLGPVALVPIFIVLLRLKSRVAASRYGALFGMVSTAIANYWLAFFGDFSIWTIGGAVIGYTGYNYILFGYLYHLTHLDDFRADTTLAPSRETFHFYAPLIIAVVWTGYEYLKSVGFLGYPWGLIAYPIGVGPRVSQIAEITGIWGLSFLGAYVNAVIAFIVVTSLVRNDRSTWNHAGAVLLLFIVAIGFGSVARSSIEPEDEVEMLLVQQNVDSWQPGRFRDALSTAQRITIEGISDSPEDLPDAIVWSETSLRVPYGPTVPFYAQEPSELPFYTFLHILDTPLITGTPVRVPDTEDYRNSAVVILPDRSTTGWYGKQQLVPFAESIPFWNRPIVQIFFREVIGLNGTWVAGAGSEPLTLPLRDGRSLAIGTPICFEDGFGWVPRELVNNGAEILVNLTNNSWSRQDSAQTQHFAAARLRSIELRTTLVRGTNSGLSGVVDARGDLIAQLPMFQQTAERVRVPVYPQRWTLYRAWGDWLGVLSTAIALLLVVLSSLASKKKR